MRGEFVDVGEERLYYYAAGTRGTGNPVVLVHGFPTSSHLWENLVPLLPDGHRIVVPDLLSFGRSEAGNRPDLSIDAHANRLIELMDALGIRQASLVGHHMGATIAIAVASRCAGRVSHLALLHPLGGDVTFAGTFAALRAFLPLVRLTPIPLVRRAIRADLMRWYSDPHRAKASVDLYLSTWMKPARWRHVLLQLAAFHASDVLESTKRLSALALPVAVVAADQDPAVPRVALDRVRDAVPNATLDIIRDVRHFSPEESPERVADVVGRLIRR